MARHGGVWLLVGACWSLLCACAGGHRRPLPEPTIEGPETAILRIASAWEARHTEKGLRSSPSPIASFERQVISRIVLLSGQATATESVSFTERFVLRDGGEARCNGGLTGEVAVAYGKKAGEPAIELAWPQQQYQRTCDTDTLPVEDADRPAGRSRFVLRSDQLVGVEPVLEKRTFLPAE